MNYLLLEFNEADKAVDNVFHLATDSYVATFVWKLLNAQDEVRVKLVKTSRANCSTVPVNFNEINHVIVEGHATRKFPMLQLDGCHNVVGLCSVLRGMCRLMKPAQLATQLLGFKENCLMSPSEVSLWTNFCEREMISCAERLRMASGQVQFPVEMMKLELDLANPVRVHNVYKVARDKKNDQSIKSGSELDLEHKYCHGNEANLSDVMLYSIYKLIFTSAVDIEDVKDIIPLTVKWFNNMEAEKFGSAYAELTRDILEPTGESLMFSEDIPKVTEDGRYFSLFKRELTGYKHKNRKIFTDQTEVDVVLEKLKSLNIEISSTPGDSNQDSIEDDYVGELLRCGELPAHRLDNKKSQLKSVANEVLKIAQSGDVIVDFCSGTGHLGFLVAKLLPHCRVIILENKEESINRAKVKAKLLLLKNVTFYQCNLVSYLTSSVYF